MVCLRLGLVRRNVTETLKRLSWTHVLSATDEVIGGRPYHRSEIMLPQERAPKARPASQATSLCMKNGHGDDACHPLTFS